MRGQEANYAFVIRGRAYERIIDVCPLCVIYVNVLSTGSDWARKVIINCVPPSRYDREPLKIRVSGHVWLMTLQSVKQNAIFNHYTGGLSALPFLKLLTSLLSVLAIWQNPFPNTFARGDTTKHIPDTFHFSPGASFSARRKLRYDEKSKVDKYCFVSLQIVTL